MAVPWKLPAAMIARIVDAAPAVTGGVLEQAARRPFVVGEPRQIVEQPLVGRGGVAHSAALAIGEKIAPDLGIDAVGTGIGIGRLARAGNTPRGGGGRG
jgi:hypothetical protein